LLRNKLLTADFHFDSDPLTEYRWGLLYVLKEEIYKEGIEELIVLGDLTEKKDNHNSTLVTRVVDFFSQLASICKVTILKGNHDYIKEDKPFFQFLEKIPNVRFITYPTVDGDSFYVPHTFGELPVVPSGIKKVFMHQTFSGAISNNSTRVLLPGKAIPEDFHGLEIFSGDIHRQQKLRNIDYVGAPYHVYFGDDYYPRFIILKDNKHRFNSFLNYEFPARSTIVISPNTMDNLKMIMQTVQLKVRLLLTNAEAMELGKHKKAIKDFCNDPINNHIQLISIEVRKQDNEEVKSVDFTFPTLYIETQAEILQRYAKIMNLPAKMIKTGLSIIA